MTFTFNSLIPAANNNPSADQPDMLTNNVSTRGIIAIDHFGFDVANGGRHLQVQLPLRGGSPGTIPPTLIAQEGTLYTKTVSSESPATETGLFYTPDLSANEYQLTRSITARFSLFGTNTTYQNPGGPTAANPTIKGGWTFLPGGLIMMYGFATPVGNTGTVTFPFAFPTTLFSLTTDLVRATTGSTVQYYVSTTSTSNFTYTSNNATSGTGIFFTAIGN